ncbi:hypothetical protein TWF481_000623 [Arthrobotrys musiformis]|uniref:Uncharacterized protein n=1 Tax=Arthrobotrys musiformis TaxID=47236 RepID=A0AAV9WN48_9PEZI
MKVSAILVAAVLAFVASGAPIADRNARRATTADLAHAGPVGVVGAPVLVARHNNPLVEYLHKRQDSGGLKKLVTNYLVQKQAPKRIIDFVETADDALVARIMQLPPNDMQNVVGALEEGKIPTIPGIPPKELVLSFLEPLGIPADTMTKIRNAPDATFDNITKLPLSQLDTVIIQLQAGKIPNIPGVTDGIPGVDPNAPAVGTIPSAGTVGTVPQQQTQPIQTTPQVGGSVPVRQNFAVGKKVKREFGRKEARQVQQLPTTGTVPTTGQLPAGSVPPLPATGAELKAYTIQDMTQGGAPAQLIQFVQTVPDATFDALRALELQVGGQNGQPLNQQIAAQLDQYWGQLFNGQMPTIATAGTGTVPVAPVATAPAAVLPVAPVATAPAATVPVGTVPVGTVPVGTVPVGTVPVGTVPGTTV